MSNLAQSAFLVAGGVLLIVAAYRVVAELSPPTSEFDLAAEPLCTGCCHPVDPRAHYCPRCGEPTGKFTPYIPYVNIRFQYEGLGRAWRVVTSREPVGVGRRLLFLAVILVYSPLMVALGVPFELWRAVRGGARRQGAGG